MITDGEYYFQLSLSTDLSCSIYAGAEPLQKEVTHRIAPNAFAAAVAEFNERNESFDDE